MNHHIRIEIPRLRDDTNALVRRAASGDQRAWSLLIGRFDATIRTLARRHGLSDSDRDEVAQRTWLALVRHIDRLGDHPAIAGWLVTTARHECLKIIRANKRETPAEDVAADTPADIAALDERLLEEERHEALQRALEGVPEHERRLMRLLLREPVPSYDEISAELGIPKGSIGPTRGRCVARLRGDQRLANLVRGTFQRPIPGHELA